MSVVLHTDNGTLDLVPELRVKRGRKPVRKSVVTAKNVSQARVIITTAMGCGIPLLCLALSHMGGALLMDECYVLGVSVLARELAGVLGHDGWIRLGVMLCVTAASMCLNCWAFFRHK